MTNPADSDAKRLFDKLIEGIGNEQMVQHSGSPDSTRDLDELIEAISNEPLVPQSGPRASKRRRSSSVVATATFPIDPAIHSEETKAAQFRVLGPISGNVTTIISVWATKRWTDHTKRVGYRIGNHTRGKAVIKSELAGGEGIEVITCMEPIGTIRATDVAPL